MPIIPFFNLIFSLLTLFGQLFIILAVFFLFIRQEKFIQFFGKKGILFSFMVALLASLGSLFYSEMAGFEPCQLCWFQRIFMYPQIIILGVAFWKKNEESPIYSSLFLSLIGAIFSGYHYFLQMGVFPQAFCNIFGSSTTCSQIFVREFGYITMPLMALTAFFLIIVFLIMKKYSEKVL
jgi:disulfide bond formation protein DsbB